MPLEDYNCVLYGPLLEAHHMFVSLATLQMEKLCIYLRCVIFITFLDSFFVHIFISMYSQYIHVAAMVEIINLFIGSLFFALSKIWYDILSYFSCFQIILFPISGTQIGYIMNQWWENVLWNRKKLRKKCWMSKTGIFSSNLWTTFFIS